MTNERERRNRRTPLVVGTQNKRRNHIILNPSKRASTTRHASFLLLLVITVTLILSTSAFMNNNGIVQYINREVKDGRIIIGRQRTHNYSTAREGNNIVNENHNSNQPLAGRASFLGRSNSSKKINRNSSAATASTVVITPPTREKNNSKNPSAKNKPIMKKKITKTGNDKPLSKKQRVRTMFRQAKEMERTGQWRQACIHLKKILEIDPYDSYSHLALGRLQSRRERGGASAGPEQNKKMSNNNQSAGNNQHSTHDMDMETATPLTIIQSGPLSEAREAFYNGIQKCPDSIHLWQAWALHEESKGNTAYARILFQKALEIDETNPYVCHGYGLLEHRCGNFDVAMELWERPLKTGQSIKSSAALVCSLAKLLVAKGKLHKARDLYMDHVTKIKSEREICEVYMAAAWLEERHFRNITGAEELLNKALDVSPGNSRALVALARLAGRKVDLEKPSNNISTSKNDVVRRRQIAMKEQLKMTCNEMIKRKTPIHKGTGKKSDVLDGRLFNAWADMEVKEKRYHRARRILIEGRKLFPADHSVSTANHLNIIFFILFFNEANPTSVIHFQSCFKRLGKLKSVLETSLGQETYMARV